jgi:hypothetical protein
MVTGHIGFVCVSYTPRDQIFGVWLLAGNAVLAVRKFRQKMKRPTFREPNRKMGHLTASLGHQPDQCLIASGRCSPSLGWRWFTLRSRTLMSL